MPRNEKRIRVERGLYRAGDTYYACATPPGARAAVWRSLGTVGLMQARRLRDKFAAEIQDAPPASSRARATFADVAADWLAEQQARMQVGELSPRTYEIYELGLRRQCLPAFGSRPLHLITPDDLVAWIRAMRAAGYAPHSVHNFWAPINLVLSYAVRHDVIAANPASRLTSAERPKPGQSRRRFLSRAEIGRLLVATPDRYRVAIACGVFSGARLSELLGLRWEDVDFAAKVIHVRQQMGRDGRHRH